MYHNKAIGKRGTMLIDANWMLLLMLFENLVASGAMFLKCVSPF